MSAIPQSFTTSKNLIYDLLDFSCSAPILEKESSDYDACTFSLNNRAVLFRSGKTTPTKIGQFVTLWKRNQYGPSEPYQHSDAFDFVVVCTTYKDAFGQFIFPKTVLIERGIVSHTNREGKRAFRVYPSWDKPTSKQAQKTQDWQLNYFYDFSGEIAQSDSLLKVRDLFD